MSWADEEEVQPKQFAEPEGDIQKWSNREVADWLIKSEMGEATALAFAQNRITGDLLQSLTESHLEKMGVETIGQRLLLMREIMKMRRKARAKKRFEVLWEAEGLRAVHGPCDWCCQKLMCVECCGDRPDKYKLTNSSLVLTQKDYSKSSSMFGKAKRTRTIDLDSVVGVSANTEADCCDCGCSMPDTVVIELDRELGLEDVDPLLVAHGEGQEIAEKIQSAIEEVEAAVPMGMERA